jgi:hypothetical protein
MSLDARILAELKLTRLDLRSLLNRSDNASALPMAKP